MGVNERINQASRFVETLLNRRFIDADEEALSPNHAAEASREAAKIAKQGIKNDRWEPSLEFLSHR